MLDEQIQTLIEAGLKSTQLERGKTVIRTTGDGAILAFDRAEDAHRFATGVQSATQQHNGSKRREAQRWFRIGMATGDICTGPPGREEDLAGGVRIDAARLQGLARGGEILVDNSTFDMLPPDMQALYGPKETIRSKNEAFAAHRCAVFRPSIREGSAGRIRLLSRRSMVSSGCAAAAAVAAGAWFEWPAIDGILHPLPERRYVALMAWPADQHQPLTPLLNGILDVIASGLARAEAYTKNLLLIRPTDISRQSIRSPNEVVGALGANLVLGASLNATARSIFLVLTVLDAVDGRVFRRRQIVTASNEANRLSELGLAAAADLLQVARTNNRPERI